MKTFYVYEHWRSDTGSCFYVGKGSRYRSNSIQRAHNRHHSFVVAKLKLGGHKVGVRIVASGLDEGSAFALEIARIAHWRSLGCVLTNLTDGGEGPSGFTHTEEAKARIRAAHTGRKRSPETCARIGAATKGKNLGKKHSPDTRSKMSAAQKGKVLSEAHRASISIARVGLSYGPHSEEHKAKIGAKSRGRKHAPETIEKMRLNALARAPKREDQRERTREAVKALWADPEYRQRQSEAHKGYVPTEEHRANLRAGQAKRGPRTEEHKARIAAAIKQKHAERRAMIANSRT